MKKRNLQQRKPKESQIKPEHEEANTQPEHETNKNRNTLTNRKQKD